MNRDELIGKIAEQLKGKLIARGYNFQIEYQIKDTLKELLDSEDYKEISVDKVNRENSFYIRYKRHYLFCLKYTKTKGKSHYRYWEDYTDYYYKDFMCGDQNADFDLKRKMYEIEIAIIDSKKARQNEFNEMLDCYNQIKVLFGDKTDKVLSYIHNNEYDLKKGAYSRG